MLWEKQVRPLELGTSHQMNPGLKLTARGNGVEGSRWSDGLSTERVRFWCSVTDGLDPRPFRASGSHCSPGKYQ